MVVSADRATAGKVVAVATGRLGRAQLLRQELADDEVVLAFAELKGVVRDRLERSGTAGAIGIDRFFPTIGQAVLAYVDATGIGWIDWEDEGDVTSL